MSKRGRGSTTTAPALSAASGACAAAAIPAAWRSSLRAIISLKTDSRLNQQKTVRARRVVRDLAEIRRGRVQIRDVELRAVQRVQRVQSHLESHPLANSEPALD